MVDKDLHFKETIVCIGEKQTNCIVNFAWMNIIDDIQKKLMYAMWFCHMTNLGLNDLLPLQGFV